MTRIVTGRVAGMSRASNLVVVSRIGVSQQEYFLSQTVLPLQINTGCVFKAVGMLGVVSAFPGHDLGVLPAPAQSVFLSNALSPWSYLVRTKGCWGSGSGTVGSLGRVAFLGWQP